MSKIITWSVTAFPLNRNLVPRFELRQGEGTRNDERCIDWVAQRILGWLKGGKLLGHPCHFLFRHGRHITLSNRIVLHDSADVVLHYSIFLVHQLNRMLGKEKKLSQIPTSMTTSPIGVRTCKMNQSSARSEMTLSWIIEQDGYLKARVRP
jgi:hypothetical protein